MHATNMNTAWEKCHDFNSEYPVGTRVKLRSAEGDTREMKTTSEAHALACGRAMVQVSGRTDVVCLDDIEVVQ